MEERKNIIVDKTLSFSLKIIQYCELLDDHRKFVISKQLLRSGTAIGASVHEAQNPHSKADFISKMKIATKEAEESKYWLYLCEHSKNYPFDFSLKTDIQNILLILYKILSTSHNRKQD